VHGAAGETDGGERGQLFTPAFIALSIAELAYFTADGMLIPLAPLFASGPLGASLAETGLAVAAFGLTALILRPIAGRMADRRGRRPLIIGGALVFAGATALHVAATSLPMLVGLRLVLGAAEAFFFVAALAALLDLAPPDRAGEALSFNSLALYIGIAAGPLIGEALLGIGGFDLGWIGAAALALTAAILALRLPETVAPGAAEGPLVIVNRAAAGPSLALFVGIMGMSGFLALVAIYARELLALDGAGVVLLLYGGVVVVCRIAFASLPDRIDPARLMTIALTLVAIGLGTMGLIATLPGLAVGTVILAVGVAFLTPAVFAAVYRRVDASERGSAAGTISLFIDFAFIGGPAIFGYIAGSVAIPIAFLVGAIVAGVGSVGTLLFVRSTRSTISAT
jgi:MFS family permease